MNQKITELEQEALKAKLVAYNGVRCAEGFDFESAFENVLARANAARELQKAMELRCRERQIDDTFGTVPMTAIREQMYDAAAAMKHALVDHAMSFARTIPFTSDTAHEVVREVADLLLINPSLGNFLYVESIASPIVRVVDFDASTTVPGNSYFLRFAYGVQDTVPKGMRTWENADEAYYESLFNPSTGWPITVSVNTREGKGCASTGDALAQLNVSLQDVAQAHRDLVAAQTSLCRSLLHPFEDNVEMKSQ